MYLVSLGHPTSSMNPKHPYGWRHFQSDIRKAVRQVVLALPPPLAPPGTDDAKGGSNSGSYDGGAMRSWHMLLNSTSAAGTSGRLTNQSWRAKKTYIELKGEWNYLYRAVDSLANSLDEQEAWGRKISNSTRHLAACSIGSLATCWDRLRL